MKRALITLTAIGTLATLTTATDVRVSHGGSCNAGSASNASYASDEGSSARNVQAVSSAAQKSDIVDLAVSSGGFQTLTAALVAADLVDVLRGEGPFTVFAPTDEAFAKLPKGTLESLLEPKNREQLVAILTYHVVPGALDAADVAARRRIGTVNGKNVEVTEKGDSVLLNDARVVQSNLSASNGVIHVIDSVLLP